MQWKYYTICCQQRPTNWLIRGAWRRNATSIVIDGKRDLHSRTLRWMFYLIQIDFFHGQFFSIRKKGWHYHSNVSHSYRSYEKSCLIIVWPSKHGENDWLNFIKSEIVHRFAFHIDKSGSIMSKQVDRYGIHICAFNVHRANSTNKCCIVYAQPR